MAKKRCLLSQIVLLLLIAKSLNGQYFIWNTDSTVTTNPNYAMERYHEVLRYNDPVMYLVYPVVKPVVDRKVPLRDGEGKDGYWAEGHFGHRFVIMQGKYYSSALLQRTRFTFDVSILTRLTSDYSNPLLPNNNKFGFGLDFLLSSLEKLRKGNGGITWLTLQIHHYSNGQADSFFLNTPQKRNNYKNGDFSANYLKGMLNFSSNSAQNNLWMGGLGYLHQISLGGPLSSSTELKKYYGDGRIQAFLQFVKKPKLLTVNTVNRSLSSREVIKREVRRQFAFRTELEYIVGDLSLFPGDNKWRIGWRNLITYMPAVTNEVGFILHTYLGRDYLNIRFDDIVFIAGIGLYVKFNKSL